MEALHKVIGRLAALLALAGGAALVLLVALTCVSITGRSLGFLGLGPVPGDFELVELGMAFAVFSFLPWCEYQEGHARVDLFKRFLGPTGNWVADVVANALMLVVSFLIAWRLGHGMVDKFGYTETTFILRLPIGWGYAAALPGAVVFVLVSASCLLRNFTLKRPWTRRRLSP